eukprot:gene35384-43630_t
MLLNPGCRLGECPSQAFKDLMRARLEAEQAAKEANAADSEDVVGKLNEVVGNYEDPMILRPLKRLKLAHGSFFGEDHKPNKNTSNKPLPTAGYLEINNKSDEVFAIKIVYSGKGIKFEIPRP